MVERVFVLSPAYNAGATIERVFERIPPAARERIDLVRRALAASA